MIKIKNWEKWQTYRADRGAPPWIKLHKSLRSNPEWNMLSDAEKGQLVSLWLLASDKEGFIPASPKMLKKICALDTEPDIKKFMQYQFVESTGVTVASPWRHRDAPETYSKESDSKESDSKESDSKEADVKSIYVDSAVEIYNSFARQNGLSIVQRLTPPRKAKLRARLKDCGGIEGWKAAIEKVGESDFLLGRVNDWKAGFDFLLRESSFTKLMEDGYKTNESKMKRKGPNDELQQYLDECGEETPGEGADLCLQDGRHLRQAP